MVIIGLSDADIRKLNYGKRFIEQVIQKYENLYEKSSDNLSIFNILGSLYFLNEDVRKATFWYRQFINAATVKFAGIDEIQEIIVDMQDYLKLDLSRISIEENVNFFNSRFNIILCEEEYSYYGDDSSDEELEEEYLKTDPETEFHSFVIREAPNAGEGSSSQLPNSKFNISFLFHDLGLRLLTAEPVSQIYFHMKKSFGLMKQVPSNQKIIEVVASVINKMIKPSSISQDQKDALICHVISNKRMIYKHQEMVGHEDLREILGQAKLKVNVEQEVQEVHDLVKKYTVTPGKKMSFAIENKKFAHKILDKSHSPVSPFYKQLLQTRVAKSKTLYESFFVQLLKAQCETTLQDLPGDSNSFLKAIRAGLRKFYDREVYDEHLLRFEYNKIMELSQYDASLLISYVRLKHLASKRYFKDVEMIPTFFTRNWKFNAEDRLEILETQQISENAGIKALVRCPHDSNYPAFFDRLKNICSEKKITVGQVIGCIKNILRDGCLPLDIVIDKTSQEFLYRFTYLLFGCEAERHPGSILYHLMLLDLISKEHIEFKDAAQKSPMFLEGAVEVIRFIHQKVNQKIKIKYFYDQAPANIEEFSNFGNLVEEFRTREKELLLRWLYYCGDAVEDLNDKLIIRSLDSLCQEFLGFSLSFSASYSFDTEGLIKDFSILQSLKDSADFLSSELEHIQVFCCSGQYHQIRILRFYFKEEVDNIIEEEAGIIFAHPEYRDLNHLDSIVDAIKIFQDLFNKEIFKRYFTEAGITIKQFNDHFVSQGLKPLTPEDFSSDSSDIFISDCESEVSGASSEDYGT